MCHLVDQGADEFGLENVAQGNPVKEAKKGFQCGMDQWCILGILLKNTKSSVRNSQIHFICNQELF